MSDPKPNWAKKSDRFHVLLTVLTRIKTMLARKGRYIILRGILKLWKMAYDGRWLLSGKYNTNSSDHKTSISKNMY